MHVKLTLDNRDSDTYRGRWHFDEVNKRFIGNPVRSAAVEDMHDACKNKDGEADRTHARAMTMEDMVKLLAYMQQQRPEDGEPKDLAALGLKAGSLLFNAFTTTGFTLWTRSVISIGTMK